MPNAPLPTTPPPLPAALAALQAAVREQDWPRAVALAQRWTEAHPTHALGWALRGEALSGAGQLALAAQALHRAARLMPEHAGIWLNLGSCLDQQGDRAQARLCYAQALQCDPELAQAHFNLGSLLDRQGDADTALSCYTAALRCQPNFTPACFNAAALLHRLGRTAEALTLCDRVLALVPDQVDASRFKVRLLFALAQWQPLLDWTEHLAQHGHAPETFALERIHALLECHRAAQAMALLQDLPRQHLPLEAWLPLRARAHLALGDLESARADWGLLAEHGHASARVQQALALCPIMAPAPTNTRAFARYQADIQELSRAAELRLDDPVHEGLGSGFFACYQAGDLRPVFEALAAMYRHLCPQLAWRAPHVGHARATPPRRPRIGIYSHFFTQHSVTVYFGHTVNHLLAHPDLDVWLLSARAVDAALYPAAAPHTVLLPAQLEQARTQIAALELDILVYTEFGTDNLGSFLAHARLAHAQCVLVGMPCTTGLPEMDWFVTSPRVEPPEAATHYRERLLLLPRVLFRFSRPELPLWRSRAELGLPEGVRLYVVPVRLHKIHPDFDALLDRILLQDPDGMALFFKDHDNADWRFQFGRRLDQTLSPAARTRIRFAQWLDEASLLQVLHASDVILDPLHFGMGATGRVAFATGTPVVALRGAYMRGRVCASMCDLLDLSDCVADDADGYVARALRAAHDLAWRASICARMLGNSAALYEVDSVSEDFAQALLRLHRGEDPSHPLARLA